MDISNLKCRLLLRSSLSYYIAVVECPFMHMYLKHQHDIRVKVFDLPEFHTTLGRQRQRKSDNSAEMVTRERKVDFSIQKLLLRL